MEMIQICIFMKNVTVLRKTTYYVDKRIENMTKEKLVIRALF